MRRDRHADMTAEIHHNRPARKILVLGREIPMPRSRAARIAIGVVLIFGGLLGFLPILGFWMVPVGLLVLSYEFAAVRRWRRWSQVRWERWRRKGNDRRNGRM
jgi:hypothetical protein